MEKTVISAGSDIVLTAYYEESEAPPTPSLDPATVAAAALGITDLVLVAYAAAHLAGLV